jgi:hypothetical protein
MALALVSPVIAFSPQIEPTIIIIVIRKKRVYSKFYRSETLKLLYTVRKSRKQKDNV